MKFRHGYLFGEFTLDLDRGALFHGDAEIKLRPKSFAVLCHLLAQHGRLVSKEELLGAVWADAAVTEDSLTQCVIDIRRALGSESHTVIRTVPRRGYIFDAAIVELAEDIARQRAAPVGVVRSEAPVPNFVANSAPEAPVRARTGVPKWSLIAAALGAVTLLAGAAWLAHVVGTRSAAIRSIAVLPFANASANLDDAYLVEGLAEAIADRLGRASAFRIVATASTSEFRNADLSIRDVAHRLGADAIVRGSLRRRGRQVDLTAQLVAAADDRELWRASYERDASELPTLQAEIAIAIADRLGVVLPLSATKPIDANAFEAYLKGKYHLARISFTDHHAALGHLTRAVAIDSEYAPAYAALAECYAYGLGTNRPARERGSAATVAARRALALDPLLPEAHAIIGYVRLAIDWNWDGAFQSLSRAIELKPSDVRARGWYSVLLATAGRVEAGLREAEAAHKLDPLSLQGHATLAWHYMMARQYDRAVVILRQALEMHPRFAPAEIGLVETLRAKGDFQGALAEIDATIVKPRDIPLATYLPYLAAAQAGAGLRREAARSLSSLESLSGEHHVAPAFLAMVYFALGRDDEGFSALEQAYAAHELDVPGLRLHPSLDRIRSDPRYRSLVDRLHLPS